MPGSETKDFMTHSIAGSMNFLFMLGHLVPKSHGSDVDGCCKNYESITAEESKLKKTSIL